MRKVLLIFSSLFAGCGILPLCLTSCSSVNSVPMNRVHEFINERTFTLTAGEFTDAGGFAETTGTSWLFYHVTNSSNNYTYYALTNYHVTEGILELLNSNEHKLYDVEIGVGFSKDEDTKANKPIDLTTLKSTKSTGTSLEMQKIETVSKNTSNSNTILYDQYFQFGILLEPDLEIIASLIMDMAVVKYDFSNIVNNNPNSDLANRLNELNNYAESHDNYVTPIASGDDYTRWKDSSYIESNIYTSGYPVVNINNKNIWNNKSFATSLKSQDFKYDDLSLAYVPTKTNPWSNFTNQVFDQAVYSIKNGNIHGFTFSNDYQYKTENKNLEFGGGASGSMGMFATDINDPNTYKACGIYWGMAYDGGTYYLKFSPFWLNWGQTITMPDGTKYPNNYSSINKTFIQTFFEKYTNTPLDFIINSSTALK